MSNPVIIILRKEIQTTIIKPLYWISCLAVSTFITWLSLTTGSGTIRQMTETSPEVAQHLAKNFPQMIFFLYSFSSFLLLSLNLFMEMFIIEKVQGQIESLLSTPIKADQLWAGKCLAVFILVYPFIVITLLAYILLWGYQITGYFVAPSITVWLTGFVGGPLLAWGLLSFLGLISFLVSRVDVVQMVTFFMSFGAMFGGTYLMNSLIVNLQPGEDLITWPIVGMLFSAVILIFTISMLMKRKLDKDQIVRNIG